MTSARNSAGNGLGTRLILPARTNPHRSGVNQTGGRPLNQLWAEIGRSSNGRTVCMPVVGGGMSRMSSIVPTQDSLRFTILSFMFASRRQRVCEELRIVLRPEDYDKLDRLELQAFLTSLKPS
ncbi:macro domain-containing protein [Mycobacterium intracellulare]|uniref:macro domain-containing protein n=2 Tax=Mycobacterium intracellulare TaxID=1767 RepID=UPI0039F62321